MKPFPALAAVFTALFLSACGTMQDATQDFDIVIGPNYTPPIELKSDFLPRRALLVAVETKGVEGEMNSFVDDFRARFAAFPMELYDSDKPVLMENPQRGDVITAARQKLCDAILYLNLREESPYPPIRMTAEVVLQQVSNGLVVWKGTADYDTQLQPVANSARRYTQKIEARKVTPDRSLSILSDPDRFGHFAAWDLSQYLNTLGKYFPVIVQKKAPVAPPPSSDTTTNEPSKWENPAQPRTF